MSNPSGTVPHHTQAFFNHHFAYAVVTLAAAIFNVLVLLVIAFSVMPRLEHDIMLSTQNRETILGNRRFLQQNLSVLKEYTKGTEGIRQWLDHLRQQHDLLGTVPDCWHPPMELPRER